MSDTTEFDLDLTLNQPLSHEQPVELFAFDDCKTYPLPDRKLLIRNPNNGKSAVIMPEVMTALAQCAQFATMENHIEAVTRAMPQLRDHPDQVRQVLDSMRREGMMISARSLCDAFNAEQVEEDPTADDPAIVAIITCDRPEALARLMDSIKEHGDPAGFEKLYVIDDSRNAENIERNQEVVDAFAAASPIETIHFDREKQRALMKDLIGKAPEHEESIRFLIDFERWKDEWTGGLARNYALLLSTGKRLVMMDDDVLFQVYEPHPRPKGMSLREEIREARFYGETGDWPGLRVRPELDPVKAHLYCLGLSMRRAMGRLGISALLPEFLAGCTAAEIRRLSPSSPVLATQCGSLGDPGIESNAWLIELNGESRERMLASDESVALAIKNENAWIGRRRPHFAPRSNMSAIVGLDNRRALPPYLPLERGEDRLFGIMLEAQCSDAAVIDYPWAAPHLAVDQDASSNGNGSKANTLPTLNGLVCGYLASRLDSSPADGRGTCVQVFKSLSRMSSEAWNELFRDYAAHLVTREMTEIGAALQSAGDNVTWGEHLAASLREVNEDAARLIESGFNTTLTVPQAEDNGFDQWRFRLGAFATALDVWQQVLTATQDIKD